MTQLPLRHVLFPYDFSRQGQLAARYVGAVARTFGARVTVLSVVPPAHAAAPAALGSLALRDREQSAEWTRTLQCRLDRALVEEFADLDVHRVADYGDAALRVADFAHNHEVDLVMMPTHGLGVFRRLLAGSVTSKVLHDVRCPVWTATHAYAQRAPAIPRSVLCAVNATTEGVALVQYAALFCKRAGATLSVLHVVEPATHWPSLTLDEKLQDEVRDTASAAVDSMLASAGVDARSRIVVGGIVERAAEAAREDQADLMIVGRGGMLEPFGRFRSQAFGIIGQSPCPVLSV